MNMIVVIKFGGGIATECYTSGRPFLILRSRSCSKTLKGNCRMTRGRYRFTVANAAISRSKRRCLVGVPGQPHLVAEPLRQKARRDQQREALGEALQRTAADLTPRMRSAAIGYRYSRTVSSMCTLSSDSCQYRSNAARSAGHIFGGTCNVVASAMPSR